MTDKAKSIVIHIDILDQIEMLNDAEAGQLFKGLLRYATTGDVLNSDDRLINVVFAGIKTQIDNDLAKYAEKCNKNKAIAIERERRKKENSNVNERARNITNVYDRTPNNSNSNNKGNNNITSVIDTPARTRKAGEVEDNDQYHVSLSNNQTFLETTCMNLKIDLQSLKNYMSLFNGECKAKGTMHQSESDYRQHLYDWVRIQVEKTKRTPKIRTKIKEVENVNDVWNN